MVRGVLSVPPALFMTPKVAIYCRLSEEDRTKESKSDDSQSIQNQKNMLLEYCLKSGWEVHQIYSDDDYTGADRNRPAFKALIEDAKARAFDIVLCKTQSRFTRELELVETYIHGLFPRLGIRFVSIVDNADTANKGNKKSRQINGLVNEWYLEDLSENIRSVLTSRRKQGFHIGAFALYGYEKDPEVKGHLIIDEEAAAIVREVFTLFAGGYGKTAIARLLNDRGVPNPTEYKRRKGLRFAESGRKSSSLWKYAAIAHMLRNEMYRGHMVQGCYGSISYKTKENKPRPKDDWYIVENTHEAIISPALWDSVQSLLATKAKPFKTGTIGLFAGKTRCAHCGFTMRSSKNRGRHYLQCATRHVAKEHCIGAFIPVAQLEARVLAELHRLAEAHVDASEVSRHVELRDTLAGEIKRTDEDLQRYEQKLADRIGCLKALYLDKVKGILTEDDYLDLSRSFTSEKEQLTATLATCQARKESLLQKQLCGNEHEARLRQYLQPTELSREMVEVLIDYIVISKRERGMKESPIEIHWNV